MIMTVSHQKQERLNSDIIPRINTGEDGVPYADDSLLIVADGLGGRGGFMHTLINRDILDREKFYDIVFNPVFGDTDDKFKNMVVDSFRELFELKPIYFTGAPYENKRTSGYFASRFLTSIVLYLIKYDKKYGKNELFDRLAKCKNEYERQGVLKNYQDALAEAIVQKLRMIADNVGFELESRISGSLLFPSTLSVTLINERKNDVEAVYLWAGDARGYMWNKDGLFQLTRDHEKDEAMYNLVSLTRDFYIESRYIRFNKPCVLFNATDGIYKCMNFASEFDLEYMLLMSFDGADTLEDVSKNIDGYMAKIGFHDDSNTIALSTYGFNSFGTLKKMIDSRRKHLDATIVAQLPDILERDYKGDMEDLEQRIKVESRALDEQIDDGELTAIAESERNKALDKSNSIIIDEATIKADFERNLFYGTGLIWAQEWSVKLDRGYMENLDKGHMRRGSVAKKKKGIGRSANKRSWYRKECETKKSGELKDVLKKLHRDIDIKRANVIIREKDKLSRLNKQLANVVKRDSHLENQLSELSRLLDSISKGLMDDAEYIHAYRCTMHALLDYLRAIDESVNGVKDEYYISDSSDGRGGSLWKEYVQAISCCTAMEKMIISKHQSMIEGMRVKYIKEERERLSAMKKDSGYILRGDMTISEFVVKNRDKLIQLLGECGQTCADGISIQDRLIYISKLQDEYANVKLGYEKRQMLYDAYERNYKKYL